MTPTPSQTVGPFFGFALPFEGDAVAGVTDLGNRRGDELESEVRAASERGEHGKDRDGYQATMDHVAVRRADSLTADRRLNSRRR